jgi:zinc protease
MANMSLRSFFAVSALWFICASPAFSKQPAPPTGVERTVPWNSETSDLTPDASIIYGRLPNGLRYAIRENDHPQNQVLVRMGMDVGSAVEADNEQGLAHFIEHMVFNGSTHVPEGEMVKMLERLGLSFGADTNASTGYTQTQYQLDLPKSDPVLIERALFLMRETASEVTFDPAAVDRERGVVIAEMRQRENYGFQSARAANDLFYPGSYYATRYPIGKLDILQNAPAKSIKALYQKWYRPDRARIVVVGPVDPAVIERQIADKFSNWKNDGPSLGDIDQCSFNPARKGEAKIFAHPEINESLSIQQLLPDGPRPDTFNRALLELKMQIAGGILDERITRRSRKEDIPYLGSSPNFTAGFCDKYASVGMNITGKDGSWRVLLPMAEQLLRQAVDYGFTEREVAEQIKRFDNAYRNAAKAENTKLSGSFAAELIGLEDDIVTDAANRQLIWLQARPFLTRQAVNAEFATWYSRLSDPLIMLTTKDGSNVNASQVLATFAESRKIAVAAPEKREELTFAYNDFGPAGTIIEDKTIIDLGIRTIRFNNGVLLNLKKTDFEDNRVRYSLRIDGGQLQFGRDNAPLGSVMAATYAQGGLEAHDIDDLRSLLAGTTVTPSFGLGSDYFGSYGSVAPKDFDLQMKLLGAYLVHPGFRDDALRLFRRPLPEIYARLDATPGSAMAIAAARIMNDNDPRFALAPIEKIQSLNFDNIRKALGNSLKNNRIEIGIVGDFDEAMVINSVAQSFGALPKRRDDSDDYSDARQTSWSKATGIHDVSHKGEANQLGWTRTWATTDDSDQKLEQTLDLLGRVITIRLIDELREKLGATYGGSASSNMSDTYPGRGAFSISTSGDPKDLAAIEAAVDGIINEVVAAPINADLFERARKPVIESYADWSKRNGTWIAIVAQAQSKPQKLNRFRSNETQFRSITTGDLWNAAKRFLADKPSYIFRALPEKYDGYNIVAGARKQ